MRHGKPLTKDRTGRFHNDGRTRPGGVNHHLGEISNLNRLAAAQVDWPASQRPALHHQKQPLGGIGYVEKRAPLLAIVVNHKRFAPQRRVDKHWQYEAGRRALARSGHVEWSNDPARDAQIEKQSSNQMLNGCLGSGITPSRSEIRHNWIGLCDWPVPTGAVNF